MAGMYRMHDLLNVAAHEAAEELRLESDRPPLMRLRGKSRLLDGPGLTEDQVLELFRSIATTEQCRELEMCGDSCFLYAAENSTRFSVNARLRGGHLSVEIKNLGR